MTEGWTTATTFDSKRIRITTPRSFDNVLIQLRRLIGTAAIDQYAAAMRQLGGVNRENFEAVVRSQLGPSEFMLFHEINHSQWLPVYGVTQRVLRLIFGNPIIAFTMMRDDLTAGLFAPVEVLLVEQDSGQGCTVVYDLPSAQVAAEDRSLLPAARELDKKLDALISSATGVPMSAPRE